MPDPGDDVRIFSESKMSKMTFLQHKQYLITMRFYCKVLCIKVSVFSK